MKGYGGSTLICGIAPIGTIKKGIEDLTANKLAFFNKRVFKEELLNENLCYW